MMEFAYFPGCTLSTKAKEMDATARACAKILGVDMIELPDWQCCGAAYPEAQDEIATKLSSVRALIEAKSQGRPLLTLCSACHHVIKRVNIDMAGDEYIRSRVNAYNESDYAGETRVVHYLEMLRDYVGFDKVRAAVKNPLKGRRVGAYYGCMLLRPSSEMAMDNPENPRIMEDFVKSLGAESVIYAMRNECCGSYASMEPSKRVIESARAAGADCLVTACPLCRYNLKKVGGMEVYYFTELLAEALGGANE